MPFVTPPHQVEYLEAFKKQWPSFAATTFAKQPSLDEFASHVGVFIWGPTTVFDLLYNLYMFAQNPFGRSADDFGLTA